MRFSLRAAEPSDDSVELLDAVGMRSISWLNLSGDASRSFLTISRSASFMLAAYKGDKVQSEGIGLPDQKVRGAPRRLLIRNL
jgi:hypothetical protein